MPELDITWLLPDGRVGGTGPDGAVSLEGGLPGDRVEYSVTGQRGRTTVGRTTRVLTPGPDRRTPPCPWTNRCGGCDLDGLTLDAQRRAKANLVRFALRLDAAPPLRCPEPSTGYRGRIKLRFSGGFVGYHAPGTHDLVPIDRCGIAHPTLQHAQPTLAAWVASHGHEGLSEIELRTDGERVVYALTSEGSVPRALREALPDLGDVALDGRRISGDPTLWLSVSGLSLRASPRSFFQVHAAGNEALVALVCEAVAQVQPDRVLDLYAGIGNLSLPMAARTGAPVLAVEREGQAIEDLQVSAEKAGLQHQVRAQAMAVERFDPSREPFDVVVLDPPRVGAPGVVTKLLRNRPKRIVYVACHAPSAARDLRAAWREGYTTASVTAVDLFPDTHHIETVVVLDRGPRSRPPKKRRRHRR